MAYEPGMDLAGGGRAGRLRGLSGKLPAWLLYFTLPIILLLVWKGADMLGYIKPYTMPSPEKVAATAIELVRNGKLVKHIVASMERVLEGFFIALVSALALGVGIGLSKRVDIFTTLVLQILRPIPPIAWIPMAILWLGIGETSKVFIIFLGAFFPILVNVVDGISGIDAKYFELASVYEIPRKKLILRVILPGATPSIMTGVRVGLGNAWVCVVAAEMIAAVSGVGYMLSDGRSLSRPDIVILGMLVVGFVGKVMDDLVKWVRAKVLVWA
ncbi:MAG: ABC transporter permease [Synergistaceae bacterium]|jgi:sulfonate transport system permease protein|nr:ABC transporter permease [Synergistaceae bacterium]